MGSQGGWGRNEGRGSRAVVRRLTAAGVAALGLFGAPAALADNVCYQYDALGRLVGTLMTPGACPTSLPDPGAQPSDSTAIKISYDRAGNRSVYQVAGAEAYAQTKIIVLPLNGFTIIPIKR